MMKGRKEGKGEKEAERTIGRRKRTAAAASVFLSAPYKKHEIKGPTEGCLPSVSAEGSPSFLISSDSCLFHAPKPVKNEHSALSILQAMLLGRD
jgi:hypothetical protein